ncbi:hypothetical protein [Pseudoalteromonas sp. OOF1S-7]|uniref:hypothetical protein n=1 Tax=Pseudoalteromonas sp. OOF1S-7 TaxID=2917757 RepID=UPI001EF444ED|nr:hypothetical protein [Pseudoalteromonas sp. OOF1S-7]MCG7536528.1 hypothetical protein [Pseudoalteromonas sp. OOF1S-7]
MHTLNNNHRQHTAIVWLVAILCLINMALILAFIPFVIFKFSATLLAVGVTELAMTMTRPLLKSQRQQTGRVG